jgi:hypothetical protein
MNDKVRSLFPIYPERCAFKVKGKKIQVFDGKTLVGDIDLFNLVMNKLKNDVMKMSAEELIEELLYTEESDVRVS